jgi:hypothetical protein
MATRARALLFYFSKEGKENMAETMQAYFFGTSFGEKQDGKEVGLAGFAIPDLGVIYRTRCSGGVYECQYAALLSLLKFIETNKKYLNEFEFEILTDGALVVYQISHRKFISANLVAFYNSAIDLKRKVNYRVSWVPRNENVAIVGLSNVPPAKSDVGMSLQFDAHTAIKDDRQLLDSRNLLT